MGYFEENNFKAQINTLLMLVLFRCTFLQAQTQQFCFGAGRQHHLTVCVQYYY